jgi:hypothetical protein
MLEKCLRLAAENEMPTLITRTRANINDMIRGHNGFGVVLNNQYGVSLVAKCFESVQ